MKAAILSAIGKPLEIANITLTGDLILDPGQVFVRMLTAGICGAQLQEIDGKKGNADHCPHLLGHEGCGINHMTGKKVVVHWRKGIGREGSRPTFGNIKAGPCTTFSTVTIVSENRVTPIPDDVPNDLAALLGCCLSTALATAENIVRPHTGDSVLIVGAGGVGLAMILACRSRGASVTAIDDFDSKRQIVESLGAEFYRANEYYAFKHGGYDIIIDTTGNSEAFRICVQFLAPSGQYVLIGQPKPGESFYIPNAVALFSGEGQSIRATQAGGFNPTQDIPRYVQMWRDGKLDGWEKIITDRIKLDQINEGIQLMRSGKAGRVMIEMQ